jgi:hypothetical protein
MVWHEVSLLEESSRIIWVQIGKMNSVQSDTVTKLATVGTQFADHTKDDDKFASTVTDSLKNISQQLRDITVSSARMAPAAPAAAAPATPAAK